MIKQEFTKSIFIDGKWQEKEMNKIEAVYNPATESILTYVSTGGKKETKRAIDAAYQAFPLWSKLTPRKRSKILYKAYELMDAKKDDLAKILTMEQGKPLKEAKAEVKSAADFLLWYAEEANRNYGQWLPSSFENKRMLVIQQPIGVVGAITPWNFPCSMITRKLAPALAAGCTVVLKPSPETPLSAIEMIKIFEHAGLPRGVVNLVTGDAEAIGAELLENKKVAMITFTGSTAVGKYLMRESANTVKKVSLELGGHAPTIVLDDANLEKAAELTLESKFRNNGQTCICANRLYIHESIAESFIHRLKEKMAELVIGNGLDENTDLGPLIHQQAWEKVNKQLEDALQKGAKAIYGQKIDRNKLGKNYFEPVLLTNLREDMIILHEETFGPILPIQTFTSEEKVIRWANETDYGLAAYIFTENLHRFIRMSEQLEYGIIGVNDVFPATPEAPFGGMKQSGIGKEGGWEGMHEFLERKFISIGIES